MAEDEDKYPASWFYAYIVVTVINSAQFVVSMIFLFALLRHKKVRTSAFNLYLVLILIPDALLVGELAFVTAYKVSKGDTNEKPFIPWQIQSIHDWVQYFYLVTNFYINAIVTYEIWTLIRRAQSFRRYKPPPLGKVYLHAVIVYVVAALYSFWYLVDAPWGLIHRKEENNKIAGYGSDFFSERAVTIIYFSVLALPLSFVFFVFVYVWHGNFLSSMGNTRELYLYFRRIILAFILFYLPGAVTYYLNFIEENRDLKFWAGIFVDVLFPLQSLVTIRLAMSKDDIRMAVNDFGFALSEALPCLSCCCRFEPPEVKMTDRQTTVNAMPNYTSKQSSKIQEEADITGSTYSRKDEEHGDPSSSSSFPPSSVDMMADMVETVGNEKTSVKAVLQGRQQVEREDVDIEHLHEIPE